MSESISGNVRRASTEKPARWIASYQRISIGGPESNINIEHVFTTILLFNQY